MLTFDFFQFPVTIFINKSDTTSTYFGKFMTMFIIGFLIYGFATSDLINKTNNQTTIQDLKQKSRPKIIISKSNFSFSTGVSSESNEYSLGYSYFEMRLISCHKFMNESNYYCDSLMLVPCTPELVPITPNEFMQFGMNGTYCLPNNINLVVSGYWDQEEVHYITAQVSKCENTTENNNYCKSEEEISNFFQNYPYFNIYLTNYNIDSTNYENPIGKKLNNYFQLVDVQVYKSLSLYLKQAIISTNMGILYDEVIKKEAVIHGDIFSDSKAKSKGGDNNVLNEFIVYSSDIKTTVLRRYQRIQDLLAQMGGICNFLLMVGFFISKIENYLRVIEIISNDLFIFQKLNKNKRQNTLPKEKKEESGIQLMQFPQNKNREKSHFFPQCDDKSFENSGRSPRFIESANRALEFQHEIKYFVGEPSNIMSLQINKKIVKEDEVKIKEQEENPMENLEKQCESPTSIQKIRKLVMASKFMNIFQPDKNDTDIEKLSNFSDYLNVKKKENFFALGLWGYIKLWAKQKKWRLNNKEKLYLKAENQIIKELDILTILKMLQDINKLKRLFLNEEQLYLFNLLSRPMIVLDNKAADGVGSNKNIEDKRYKYSVASNDSLERAKIVKCYHDIKLKAESPLGTDIDKKMIKLLDEDVISFLQSD